MLEGFWWAVGATLGYAAVWLCVGLGFLVLAGLIAFIYLLFETHKAKKERAEKLKKDADTWGLNKQI